MGQHEVSTENLLKATPKCPYLLQDCYYYLTSKRTTIIAGTKVFLFPMKFHQAGISEHSSQTRRIEQDLTKNLCQQLGINPKKSMPTSLSRKA